MGRSGPEVGRNETRAGPEKNKCAERSEEVLLKKVSIIIPVYKVEKYIDQCLESVTSQTYSNLEIILVDDGSPDNCPEICEQWKRRDDRIRVIH